MAMTRALLLLLLLTLFLAAASPAAARRGPRGGVTPWGPIGDLSDPRVSEIARFAVSEHNKEANAKLALSRVVKGESQAVDGVNYKLVIEANDDGALKMYEVIVWVTAQENFMQLTSFMPLNSSFN